MGKNPKNPRTPGGKKKPKLNPATIKQDLKKAITNEMEVIRREKGLDLLFLNKALGIGDINTFKKEWEKHFSKSTPLRKLSKDQKAEQELIKPKLTKVSVEYIPKRSKRK